MRSLPSSMAEATIVEGIGADHQRCIRTQIRFMQCREPATTRLMETTKSLSTAKFSYSATMNFYQTKMSRFQLPAMV